MTAKEIVFLVIMFQTEPIIWLQSFHSDALTWCMRGASMLVDDSLFLVLALVVLFGFDHRRGFTLLLTLLWVALLTAALKSFFAFPRPSVTDMRVLLLETGLPNTTPFLSHGATWLLGLPSPDVISYVRAMPSPDFGIPSGHCSSTVAFWGSLAYLFRKRWMAVLALCLGVIMPFSRMYLGQAFCGRCACWSVARRAGASLHDAPYDAPGAASGEEPRHYRRQGMVPPRQVPCH